MVKFHRNFRESWSPKDVSWAKNSWYISCSNGTFFHSIINLKQPVMLSSDNWLKKKRGYVMFTMVNIT